MNSRRLTFNLVLLLDCVLFALVPPTLSATDLDVPAEVLRAQEERIALIKRIKPCVVAIFAPKAQGGGSGVVISPDGFVVTNFHVVQGLGNFMKCGLSDGRVYDAVLVGVDPTGDLAIVQLLGRTDFPSAEFGNSDAVHVGDPALAAGNPFLLADDFQPTVTWGMVSGVHRYQYPAGTFLEYTDCIQVDASINPGNSGGPLFNTKGEIVGINGRISAEKRGKVNVGAGYAISSNQVLNFLDHLKSGRVVDHATLGATVVSDSGGAVLVRNVLETSSAWRRGLRAGDELVSFAGRPIRSVNQFKNILGIYPRDWKLPLSYRREGQQFDVIVRLEALHTRADLNPEQMPSDEPGLPEEPRPPGTPDGPVPPTPHGLFGSPPPPPKEFAHFHEEKHGFINYRYNRLATEGLLKSLAPWGEFKSRTGLWTIHATGENNVPIQFKLASDAVAVRMGDKVSLQPLASDQEALDQPAGTGGLLMALEHFRQFLTDPQAHFTELYYLGSEPDVSARMDVLIATRGTTISRWYFSRPEPRLIGFDFEISDTVDPCEIRWTGFLEREGRKLPERWIITHGDGVPLTMVINDFQFEEGQP